MSNYTYMTSSFVSNYYEWFCDLGYPQVDLVEHKDGSWSLIEMLNAPVIPSLTKWRYIARNIKNREPTLSGVKRILNEINPQRNEVWERESKKTQKIEDEYQAREERVELVAEEWTDSVRRNPALQERIAKNGLTEILPHNIAKHCPESKLKSRSSQNAQHEHRFSTRNNEPTSKDFSKTVQDDDQGRDRGRSDSGAAQA